MIQIVFHRITFRAHFNTWLQKGTQQMIVLHRFTLRECMCFNEHGQGTESCPVHNFTSRKKFWNACTNFRQKLAGHSIESNIFKGRAEKNEMRWHQIEESNIKILPSECRRNMKARNASDPHTILTQKISYAIDYPHTKDERQNCLLWTRTLPYCRRRTEHWRPNQRPGISFVGEKDALW